VYGLAESGLTFAGLAFLVFVAVLTLRLSREYAPIPLLITVCYMPLGQQFVVAGLNLELFRILLLIGWIRVVGRGEIQGLVLTTMDKLFLWWAAATLVLGTLADPTGQRFINRGGQTYNALGTYFLFRCWIRDSDDLVRAVKLMAVLIVPLAVSMLVEKSTSHNVFSVFGGVPEVTFAREGKLRCQGAFRHPILAGTYGATMFPLFVGLWLMGKSYRRPAIMGIAAALVVTVAAASSGALLAAMAATAGLVLWRFRLHMRWFRRGTVLLIIALALVMKAPVWYIFSRLSEVAGGTGWYRSYIIDMAVSHFSEWWLVGSTYTAHWAPGGEVMPGDPNNMDIINNYVAEGLGGGVVKLGLFVAMIVVGFKAVGRWMHREEWLPPTQAVLIWSLGVCLAAHCICFFSVSYFDQIIVMWYWVLANLAMLGAQYRSAIEAGEEVEPALEPAAEPVPTADRVLGEDTTS
jgi:hypothetical protein